MNPVALKKHFEVCREHNSDDVGEVLISQAAECLFRSQSGDICWDMQAHLAWGCSPSHLPGRAGISVRGAVSVLPRCSMQGPQAVALLTGVLQAPIFASEFLFPSCPWH